jgi:hypothetical protein
MVIHNARGNFSFIAGGSAFSSGCVADKGYEIVHVTFKPLVEMWAGLEIVKRYIEAHARPLNSLCGMELRVPAPFSVEDFARFNQPYQERLTQWNLAVGGRNPVARTNVADQAAPVKVPSLYGFFYTIPSHAAEASFILSGVAEARWRSADKFEVIAQGDTSEAGLRAKLEFVLGELDARLKEMQGGWSDVTHINMYTVHDVRPLIGSAIVPATKNALRYGLCWYCARPPVVDLALELDARATSHEQVVKP